MRGIVTFLLSVLLLEIDTAVIGNDLCAINTYNGHCISKQRFMKENCPEYCEDFKSSAYKCEDDIDTDCAAVKAAGLCDPKEAQELSMFVDSKCPLTCQSCPHLILLQRPPVTSLDTPTSIFSNHSYEDHTECLASESGGFTALNSISSIDNIYNSTMNVTAAVDPCDDRGSECAKIVAMDQCDDYPVWASYNCAKSCGDCDGKRSAAILKETKHLLRDDDGSGCVDLQADCFERIRDGSCQHGDLYMTQECRRSCRLCHPKKPDPDIDQAHSEYAKTQHEESALNDISSSQCRDRLPNCRPMKREAACEKNKPYMYTQCSRTCRTCDYFDDSKRCTRPFLNISEAPAFGPGEMGQMFRNLKTKFGHRFNITYLSTSPWVVTIDNFISDDEIKAMMNGVSRWYDINSEDYSKYSGGSVITNDVRGVLIGWCFGECDKASRGVLERMKLLTGVPINNVESFQMLEYSIGLHHHSLHHDYIPSDLDSLAGNRVLSFFMYLSDVEEGGETELPKLGLKIQPKKGRAAMWVNSLDADPYVKDVRTEHQGNPPIKGIKYAANVGIHMYDVRTVNDWQCSPKVY